MGEDRQGGIQENRPQRVIPRAEQTDLGCSGAMRSMTSLEMLQAEQKQAEYMRHLLNSFLMFPNSANYKLLEQEAPIYQGLWMNGRKRVLSDY